MKLLKWLKKQYEKRLPYSIVDVTMEGLLEYKGGKHVILCKNNVHQEEVIEYLIGHGWHNDNAYASLLPGRRLVIWRSLVAEWPAHLKNNDDFKVWLRVVDEKTISIDDLL